MSGIPSRPTSISTVSVTGPFGPWIVVTGGRIRRRAARAAGAARRGSFQSIHMPEPDRLLGLARGVGQDALLAQADELGDAERLDVALAT